MPALHVLKVRGGDERFYVSMKRAGGDLILRCM